MITIFVIAILGSAFVHPYWILLLVPGAYIAANEGKSK